MSIGISSLSWVVRYVASKHISPNLAMWIAPKMSAPSNITNGLPNGDHDLKRLAFIPKALHNDPIFQRCICPITLEPIRYIVGDPNGHGLYEKSAIKKWIEEHGNSPLTHKPLNQFQLVPKPGIQALIDYRLDFYSGKLKQNTQMNS